MTTYTEAVTEARRLIKRSEADQWRLAQLTWEQVEAGKTRTQWARDIGVHENTTRRWYKVWLLKINDLEVGQTITYSEAWNQVIGRIDGKYGEYEVRNLPPERKAEVVREALADPEVAERIYDTPERRVPGSTAAQAIGNLARAGEKARQRDAERTERKTTEDPTSRRIDEREALHDLAAACDRFARDTGAALRRVGELPDNEKRWLTEAADRAGHALASIRGYIDTGHTDLDAELIALLNGGTE